MSFVILYCTILLSSVAISLGKLPHFSWNTLPVFYHSANQSGDFSHEALQVLAKYSMVTIEKQQGRSIIGVDDEDAMAVAMKQVKSINPNTATYFYMNSHRYIALLTRTARQFNKHPDWFLQDDKGERVKDNRGDYIFDVSKLAVRNWWKDTCLNATSYSSGDGCFCDSSNPVKFSQQNFKPPISSAKKKQWVEGLKNLSREVQEALGNDRLLIGKAPDQPYVKAAMIEYFYANNDSINALMEGVNNGKVMQVHVPIGTNCRSNLTNYISAFLIGAGNYSYFGCGQWYSIGSNTEPLTWREEYDKPLGSPEPPIYKNHVWSRKFSSGTVATFDTSTNTGEIHWSSKKC